MMKKYKMAFILYLCAIIILIISIECCLLYTSDAADEL